MKFRKKIQPLPMGDLPPVQRSRFAPLVPSALPEAVKTPRKPKKKKTAHQMRVDFYRKQLKSSPGQWFIWKENQPHGSGAGNALRMLYCTGVKGVESLKGLDRSKLPYEAATRKREDGTFTTWVRYVDRSQTSVNLESKNGFALKDSNN